MKRAAITPTFPMTMYGIEVLNVEEAQIVLQLVKEDKATRDALQFEERLRHVMEEQHLSAYDAKIYLLNGGSSCDSISSWL